MEKSIYSIVGRGKTFTSEKRLNEYLLRFSEAHRFNIKIEVYKLDSQITGDILDKQLLSNRRDLQLKGILEGDNLLSLIDNIQSKINEIKDNWVKNTHTKKLK